MTDAFDLGRFLTAQESSYATVLGELQAGLKRSHWIWFIFPQIAGLGQSPTSRHYAIGSRAEAQAYLAHPVLGGRLRECLDTLDHLPPTTAERIFGGLDAMKVRSSLTLFSAADPGDPIIRAALERWFGGRKDETTLELLRYR